MNIEGATVVVIGSSGVIGGAIATAFAHSGANLVLGSNRRPRNASDLAARLESEVAGRVVEVQADVTQAAGAAAVVDRAIEAYGRVDVLVNAAGATVGGGNFADLKVADWLEAYEANLIAAVLPAQAAAEAMVKVGGPGRIINISSVRGLQHAGRVPIMAYSAAKAALISFTTTLAKELGPDVLVNAVAPGFVQTPNYDSMSDELKRSFLDATLTKAWVPAKDIAEAALFLVKCDSVTGQVLVVDGGFTLKFE